MTVSMTCNDHGEMEYLIVMVKDTYPMPFVKNSKYPQIHEIAERFDEELGKLKQSGGYQQFFDK